MTIAINQWIMERNLFEIHSNRTTAWNIMSHSNKISFNYMNSIILLDLLKIQDFKAWSNKSLKNINKFSMNSNLNLLNHLIDKYLLNKTNHNYRLRLTQLRNKTRSNHFNKKFKKNNQIYLNQTSIKNWMECNNPCFKIHYFLM